MNESLRRAALIFQALFNDFDPVTQICNDVLVDSTHAPLFIVGAPRTGTTLLYQLLLQRYQLAYISNIMSALPRFMIRICRRWPQTATDYTGPLQRGYFGYLSGLHAPSEAGKVFGKWFQSPIPRDRIRCTFATISETTKRPLLIKNLPNSLRIPQISAIFPRAGFIVAHRDARFTAQSIIEAREKVMGSANRWWSVAVPGKEHVTDRDPCFQAVWQVIETDRLIAQGLAHHPGPSVHIDYETLCDSPVATLNEVARVFQLRITARKQNLEPPAKSTNAVRCAPERWSQIDRAWHDLSTNPFHHRPTSRAHLPTSRDIH